MTSVVLSITSVVRSVVAPSRIARTVIGSPVPKGTREWSMNVNSLRVSALRPFGLLRDGATAAF